MSEERIHISPTSSEYDVVVSAGSLDCAGQYLAPILPSRNVHIISDSNVAPLYLERLRSSLAMQSIQSTYTVFPAGEASKNLATLSNLLEDMALSEVTRSSTVIALGGGVTGDMAGLAAALYMRGISYVQIPTTLLAMVDSSVGGKCAVDLAAGKNLAGAFLQPLYVLADISTLATLDDEVFADGCAEVIKHAVLADPELFDTLSERPLKKDDDNLYPMTVIATSIGIKRRFVEADEHEQGLRKLLNLGHTIGHAVEAASGYTMGHGHAVAIGLCAIARASERLGWAEEGVANRIESVVAAHGLPTWSPYPAEDLIGFAHLDKKADGTGITLAIPEGIGSPVLKHVSMYGLERIIGLGVGA